MCSNVLVLIRGFFSETSSLSVEKTLSIPGEATAVESMQAEKANKEVKRFFRSYQNFIIERSSSINLSRSSFTSLK